jgi:hypothetical protein
MARINVYIKIKLHRWLPVAVSDGEPGGDGSGEAGGEGRGGEVGVEQQVGRVLVLAGRGGEEVVPAGPTDLQVAQHQPLVRLGRHLAELPLGWTNDSY